MKDKIEIGHCGNNILISSDGTIYIRGVDTTTINLLEISDIILIGECKDTKKIELDKQS